MEELSEEEKKALRGSKFAPLPSPSSCGSEPRLAHPGGPLKTNKAAALAKFLDRKSKDATGLASLDPRFIELAVKNAKQTLQSSGTSSKGRTVQHVDSFGDSEESAEDEEIKISVQKKSKKNKKRKKLKKEKHRKKFVESSSGMAKKPKKKLKL